MNRLSGRVLAAIALVMATICGVVVGVVLVDRAARPTAQPSTNASAPVTSAPAPSTSNPPTTDPTDLPTVSFPTDQPTTAPTTGPTTGPPADFPAVFDRVRSGTVRVLASTCSGTGIGTGFLLDSRTVLTALPTVARAVSVAVVVDGKPVPATVQSESRSVGFASLRLSRAVSGHHFRPSSTTPGTGEAVGIVGVPADRTASRLLTASVVSNDAVTAGNRVNLKGLLALSDVADLGLGGAPVVDGAGRAVGMIVAPQGEPGLKAIPGTALFTLDGGDSPDRGRCGKPAGPRVPTTITGDAPDTIRATLQGYFDGINTGDIDAVYAAFEPGVLKGSRSATEKGFRSTYDFTIRIRASQGPNAWVTFDSIFAKGKLTEKPSYTCARWSRVFIFNETNGRARISRVENRGSDPLFRRC
jgi:hypothetical protein